MPLTEFIDKLGLKVTLTSAGKAVKVHGGDVKLIELDLESHGFSGALEFIVADDKKKGGGEKDELLEAFLKPDLFTVALELRGHLLDDKLQPQAQPIKLTGVVQERWLCEVGFRQVQGAPVLIRRYGVRFADPAQVLWRQHHPVELYTKKSVKDVLQAHKGEHIQLDLRWPVLETVQPLLFLGLDPAEAASFYDWVLWYVDSHAGCLALDYKKGKYALTAEKAAAGAPLPLVRGDVLRMTTRFPAVLRCQPRILNASTEDSRTQPVPQPQAAAPLHRDFLVRTPIAAEFDERLELEKKRHQPGAAALHIEFCRFPSLPLRPGDLCDFKLKEQWFAKIPGEVAVPAQFKTATLRVLTLHLRARAEDEGVDADPGMPASSYRCTLEGTFEGSDDPTRRLPPFARPRYPRFVEGKIVSESGAKEDLTYQIYTDGKTSLDTYQVKIPLWADQQIALPFNPGYFPGHFYFPAYKDQRVLVALDVDRAWLERFLEWRPEARLPMEGQGDQLLLGKSTKSFTSVEHRYEEEKPVFHILRTNDKDTAIIKISEGALMLRVKQEK